MSEEKKETERKFIVHNVYLKDSSFEAPNTPTIFRYDWQPQTDLDIKMGNDAVQETLYEVSVKMTITVKLPKLVEGVAEEKGEAAPIVAFITEVEEAALFTIVGFSAEEQEHMMASACPAIIYPYLREVVSNLVLKGGFPQVVLPPMNFEAMYARHLQQQQQTETTQKVASSSYLK